MSNVTPNTYTGRKTSIGTTGVQISSSSQKLRNGVTVLASGSNSATVYVGCNSGITANTSDTADGFPLAAGGAIFIETDNVNKVYVISTSANQVVFWMGS
jgi:hypothetical protein